MAQKNEREKGMMTVEGVLSLVPFIIVILGIISFINIFTVHNKIQYALYQKYRSCSSDQQIMVRHPNSNYYTGEGKPYSQNYV